MSTPHSSQDPLLSPGALRYDNARVVAALLYFLALLPSPTVTLSAEDHRRLGEFLGSSGRWLAVERHRGMFMPTPPHPTQAPRTQIDGLDATASSSTAAYTSLTFSTKILGKRKASADLDAEAEDDRPSTRKRTRHPPPIGTTTCQWDSCGATVQLAHFSTHMKDGHFGGQALSHHKGEEKCRWNGCVSRGRMPGGGWSGTAGVVKHIRDVHTHAIDVPCRFAQYGCPHTERRDAADRRDTRTHADTCLFNPANRRRNISEKENTGTLG